MTTSCYGSKRSLVFAAALFLLPLATPAPPSRFQKQEITPAPAGPFRVDGNRVLDSNNSPFLMRGTQLTEFRLQTAAHDRRSGIDFGPHSATTLSAIRLRFNMNTVRLPVNVLDGAASEYFDELARVVRLANELELLVILAAREPGAALPTGRTADFWRRCAAYFKNYPNVMFDAFAEPAPQSDVDPHSAAGWKLWNDRMRAMVRAIRSTGAEQPVIVMSWRDDRLFEGAGPEALLDQAGVIYAASPNFVTTRTDAQRDAHFGFLAARVPVHINDWDLRLDDEAACSAIPSDPSDAAMLVRQSLDYFEARRISWTVSVFEPGKLIRDFSLHDATSLENGWTCGRPVYPYAGMGRVIQGYLRASEERELFVVSGSGSPDVARGAFALAYGPVMAERDSRSADRTAPKSLGRISARVTDSRGVQRPAGILWASAGWGQMNFVIPEESAPGPARMSIVREDGSSTATNITIAETAPGFVTGHSCRGPAIGSATQVFPGGRTVTSNISSCAGITCSTIAVPVDSGAATHVRLLASGVRHAASLGDIVVTIGGVSVPVVSFGVAPEGAVGSDQVTIEIPASLRGLGESDLIARVNGRVSNAVRIRIGGGKPVS